jgi:outer membrane lipoprotein-sorting protein
MRGKPEARSQKPEWGIFSRILLASGFWLLASFSVAAQNTYTLDQVLTKLGDAGKSFRSMQGALERTKVTVLVNDKYTDSGTVYFARSGRDPRIKIEINKPEEQRMLIDMGKALLYYPKLKQVQEYQLGKNQDKAEFMLIGFGQSKEDLEKVYNTALLGEETIDGHKTSIIELKPKDPKAAALFTNIQLWIDQQRWIPIQIKTTEASRDYMIMKLTNIKMNVNIPSSTFDLKLPKDVQKVKI